MNKKEQFIKETENFLKEFKGVPMSRQHNSCIMCGMTSDALELMLKYLKDD